MSMQHKVMSVHCKNCLLEAMRFTIEGPCPECGQPLYVGPITSTMMRRGFGRKKAQTFGKVGEVSEELRDYIDAALRRNREDACR